MFYQHLSRESSPCYPSVSIVGGQESAVGGERPDLTCALGPTVAAMTLKTSGSCLSQVSAYSAKSVSSNRPSRCQPPGLGSGIALVSSEPGTTSPSMRSSTVN